jgi:hypothetical protein
MKGRIDNVKEQRSERNCSSFRCVRFFDLFIFPSIQIKMRNGVEVRELRGLNLIILGFDDDEYDILGLLRNSRAKKFFLSFFLQFPVHSQRAVRQTHTVCSSFQPPRASARTIAINFAFRLLAVRLKRSFKIEY